MKVAYIEMVGGAAGNMLAGAFVDLGVPLAKIESLLRTIPVAGWRIETSKVVKRGIAATYLDVVVAGEDLHRQDLDLGAQHGHVPSHVHGHGHGHDHRHDDDRDEAHHHEGEPTRHLSDVLEIIDRSLLSRRVKQQASSIYVRLAEAEARVHGTTVEKIHFHEVGQIDAIVDVAITCIALELLGIERVYCSPFPVGHGAIGMAHGRYPNPPPATLELLRGMPVQPVDVAGELVTTTAAAILSTLVEHPGVRPTMRLDAIGYGAGRSDFSIPNITRVTLGELAEPAAEGGALHDNVLVLEANVDDMDPRWFEGAFEAVLEAGAYDVWLQPVQMKKSRPAWIFGAVCNSKDAQHVADALLEHTTTLGVRMRPQDRLVLPRRMESVETVYGNVRVKVSRLPSGRERRTVEYDDIRAIAEARGLPVEAVLRAVRAQLEG